MREGRGSHFDPDILDAFLGMSDEFQRIARQFADSDADMAEKTSHFELVTASSQASS